MIKEANLLLRRLCRIVNVLQRRGHEIRGALVVVKRLLAGVHVSVGERTVFGHLSLEDANYYFRSLYLRVKRGSATIPDRGQLRDVCGGDRDSLFKACPPVQGRQISLFSYVDSASHSSFTATPQPGPSGTGTAPSSTTGSGTYMVSGSSPSGIRYSNG